MKFLLDTDHISILQKQAGPEFAVLVAHIAQVQRTDLAFCIISFHEQVLGCNVYLAIDRYYPRLPTVRPRPVGVGGCRSCPACC